MQPTTGRKIERFTPFERAAHWANRDRLRRAGGVGLVMAFGKFFLLPVLGATLFGWLTYALKTAAQLRRPAVRGVAGASFFFTFVRDNWPRRGDLTLAAKGGGLLSGHEPPSHRFNAGEKVVFWLGVFLLGLVVVGSGLVLDKLIPGMDYTRGTCRWRTWCTWSASVLMMALFLGHIYIGTIGMNGAYSAMRTGYVDEDWAHEHHELWDDDVRPARSPRSARRHAGRRAAARQGGHMKKRDRACSLSGAARAASALRQAAAAVGRSQGQGGRGRGQDRLDGDKVAPTSCARRWTRCGRDYLADAKKAGKDVQAGRHAACADPGPFAYTPPGGQAARSRRRPFAAATAAAPPSTKTPAATS